MTFGRWLGHERRVLLLTLLGGVPLLGALIYVLHDRGASFAEWALFAAAALAWVAFALLTRVAVVSPLRTLSNLLAALREEDYSFRGRALGDDALSHVTTEANALADTLHEQRLGALEATALLRKVVQEIDVAVFTFDQDQCLRFVNRAGERAVARPAENLLGRTASEMGLVHVLESEAPRVLEMALPAGPGRWEAKVSTFRQRGLPHRLLVMADVSRALRDEERQAWQRLIRVLGHELNNSLTPIRSIAGSLESVLGREELPPDWKADVLKGLSIIASRSDALGRFMEAYSHLARLPAPHKEPTEVGPLVHRVAGFETRLRVLVREGRPATLSVDAGQIEQLLINLLRNAVDAALETGGGASMGWETMEGEGKHLEILVDDEGPGLPETANLFVPFFTTKPTGSGIGLVLARQIAEAHGGSLTLGTRSSGPGCRARLRLPRV